MSACAGVGNAPDRAAGIVGNEQRAVLGDGKCGRAAPDLGALSARGPKTGREILVVAFGSAVFEGHQDDLVAGRLGSVPRSLQRHKQLAFVLRRELVALVKNEVEQ